MSKLDYLQKRSVECLRLAADCTQIAASVHRPVWRAHFMAMAKEWRLLAETDPSPQTRNEELN
jgi:hypothetical protein